MIHRLHLVEAAAQPRVDGAARDVQHRRDLARRVLEQVAKDDHGALIRRQPADRGEERLVRGVRCCCRGRERRLEVGLGPQRSRASVVDRPVDDDAVQPRSEGPAAIEAIEVPDRSEKRLLGDVLRGGGVVDDEVRGLVGASPVEAEQLVEGSLGPALRAAHERPLISPSRCHSLPTVRRIGRWRSMPEIRIEPGAEVHGPLGRPAAVVTSMKRRAFLVAAAAPLVAGAVPERLLAAAAGGGVVALVTADLESHLVAVDASSGRIVKRIPVSPGPRSIESNGFGQALVAHTAFGRVSILDAATLTVVGHVAGLGEPRYAAMHPTERLAYVSESRRGCRRGDRSRPAPDRRPCRRSRPGTSPLVERGRPEPLGRARHEGDACRRARRLRPTSPRLVRTIQPPFLAHDVVWAPGDEHVWVTSGARSGVAVYARDARCRCCAFPRVRRRSTSRSSALAPTSRAARTASVSVHRLDGSIVRRDVTVPVGSYNISFDGPAESFAKPGRRDAVARPRHGVPALAVRGGSARPAGRPLCP